jgi:branched-chain amino acid transport system ATP-binding protein
MLEVDAIEVRYGNIVALSEVSFRVNEGEIVTLFGANGAGKSTSLRSVSAVGFQPGSSKSRKVLA